MTSVRLKPGRDKSVIRLHPWVYSGAVAEVLDDPGQGETVAVYNARREFLAWGAYSPHSKIRVRIWSWNRKENIAAEFFHQKLTRAFTRRNNWPEPFESNAKRLVYAESDGLPGLIVDQYAGILVVQYLSSGADYWRETIVDLLVELIKPESIYERSDAIVRELEGLPLQCGVLWGAEPPERIEINDGGLRFWVDVRHGHKTGFYIDQHKNRRWVKALSHGKEVLDCFSYTGGFTLSALAGGAKSVLAVDTSVEALSLAAENLLLNGLPRDRVEWREGDVFKVLRELRDRNRSFDLIVLDPPKFATSASHAEQAARGYKDINLLAFKLLRSGGRLVTFSCSGGIGAELFQKILAGAALDAGVEAQIIQVLRQSSDHPVALNYPEGAYLKGFVLQV